MALALHDTRADKTEYHVQLLHYQSGIVFQVYRQSHETTKDTIRDNVDYNVNEWIDESISALNRSEWFNPGRIMFVAIRVSVRIQAADGKVQLSLEL